MFFDLGPDLESGIRDCPYWKSHTKGFSVAVRLFKTQSDNVIAVGVIERRALLRHRRRWAA